MPNPEKIKYVEAIKEDLKGIDGLVLADFKGLTVLEQDDLRKKVDKEGGSARVIKNTLLKKAFDDSKIEGLNDFLINNTIVFSSKTDIMRLLKIVSDFSRQHDKFTLKGGYLDGRAYDKAGVIVMAQMPSRKELLGQIAGNMYAMVGNVVGVLDAIVTKFVGTVEALEKKKEN